jgi:hypothetical protein
VTTCGNCGQAHDSPGAACPYCRARAGDELARLPDEDRFDRLDRSLVDSLLARSDTGLDALLARDVSGPLAISELRDAVARVDRGDPSVAELEQSFDRAAATSLDGIALSELVDSRGADAKLIRRGLVLLRNRRWAEALEWWSLHREGLDPSRDRLELLLLLLEAFTHRLAGNVARAGEVRARIAAHPLYRKLRGQKPAGGAS